MGITRDVRLSCANNRESSFGLLKTITGDVDVGT